jgi:MscS family membrane protein
MDFARFLPPALQVQGPRGLLWWQWLGLPAALALAVVAGLVLGQLTRVALGALTRRTRVTWDDRLLEALAAPLGWLWAVGAASVLLDELLLPAGATAITSRILRTSAFLVFFWVLLRLVTLLGRTIEESPWASAHPAGRSLLPLGMRIGRIAVAAMALVAVMADLGYPVASLVTGLGIGGLAIALAGQKTVENLFGAFSIGLDQPFAVGDTIRVDTIEGVVEAIGLRSTRIRTADRSLVTMPNGKLAELRVESLSARDRLRMYCSLGLAFGTTAAQVRTILAGLEAAVRAHPRTWQDLVVVRFREIGGHALELEVMVWFVTSDFEEFRVIRQELLLAFMEVVERAGSSFAVPARAVHLVDGRRPG